MNAALAEIAPHQSQELMLIAGLPQARLEYPTGAQQVVEELLGHGIKRVLLDWDGCVMRISRAHAVVALQTANELPAWSVCGRDVDLVAAEAAYTGNMLSLFKLYDRLGGVGTPHLAQHGVPWDQLFEVNLIELCLSARHVAPELISEAKEQFRTRLPGTIDALHQAGALRNFVHPSRDLIPAVESFLLEAFRRDLPVDIITMTPTSLCAHFAEYLNVRALVGTIHGCDQFCREDFPRAKLDPRLWQSAARRVGAMIQDCAVVEDNCGNLESAAHAGAGALVSLSQKANFAALPDGRNLGQPPSLFLSLTTQAPSWSELSVPREAVVIDAVRRELALYPSMNGVMRS